MPRMNDDAFAVRRPAARHPLQGYVDHLRADSAIHFGVAVYAAVGVVVSLVLDVPQKFMPFSYATMLARALPLVALVFVIVGGIQVLRSPSPLATIRRSLNGLSPAPHTVAGAALFASLCVFIGVFTSLKTMLPDMVPFFADEALADLDHLLHRGDAWRIAAAVFPTALTEVMETVYFGAWFSALACSIVAVLVIPSLQPLRARYLWSTLILWPLLGNVVAALVMSAGPLYFERVAGSTRFAELVTYLSQHAAHNERVRELLWDAHTGKYLGAGAGISAFPSMHVAVATMLVLLVWSATTSRLPRIAVLAFCLAIMFGSVFLGWHYAVDGYFSVVASILIWLAVGRVLKTRGIAPRPGLSEVA